MKFKIQFGIIALVVFGILACTKTTQEPNELSTNISKSTEISPELNIPEDGADERGGPDISCSYRIRVNSVSPSNGLYLLSVTDQSHLGYPQLIKLSKVPSECGDGIQNDGINQWYQFNVPPNTNFKVQLSEILLAGETCPGAPNGSSISYTIQGPPQPYPNTNTFTKTLVWYNGSPITFDLYNNNTYCNMTEKSLDDM
jgi:hypothetical protein